MLIERLRWTGEKRSWLVGIAAAALAVPGWTEPGPAPASAPATRRVDVVERLHGVEIPDPYRWLEEMSSGEVAGWARSQDERSRAYLESRPEFESIRARIAELGSARQIGDYVERAGRAFYLEGGEGRAQPRLVVEELATGARRVLVDPATRGDGGRLAIADSSLSPDGSLLAVALVDGPSRHFDWSFVDVASGRELPDRLREAKIGTGPSSYRNPWSADGSTFFYTRYTSVDRDDPRAQPSGLTVFRHRLGEPQEHDPPLYSRPDADAVRFDASVTGDGRHLLIHEWAGGDGGESVWLLRLDEPSASPQQLVEGGAASLAWIGSEGSRFWFRTDDGAPRGRLVEADRGQPGRAPWRELVAESSSTLAQAHRVGDFFVLAYLRDARNELEVRRLDGALAHRLEFADGLIWQYTQRYWSGITGDPDTETAFVRSLGPTAAGSVFRLDLASGELSLARRSGTSFPLERTVTRQVFFASHDGERIPMFLVGLDGAGGDRPRPTLLWVYGAYGWTAQPFLNPMLAVWLERGGLVAMPNVRGGGAYGEAWRLAGSRANKVNTIYDTVAAAEWLVREKVTAPELLAVFGNSAGATAAAGAMVSRPELFAAGVFEVPVADVVRARHFTGGAGWLQTFGDVEVEAELRAMLEFSPYARALGARCVPPALVTAGDQDVTAVPMHAYKLTAALQHANGDCGERLKPAFLRVDWETDHGMNKPMPNLRAEQVAELSFLLSLLPSSDR